jgi:cellulose synthase/poly-beta-1,6-N-acetylglucosamine synthase-like glycosyltransferase
LTHLFIIAVPTIPYYYMRVRGTDLFFLHVAIATIYFLMALMILSETSIAMWRRFAAQPIWPRSRSDAWWQAVKGVLGMRGARRPDPVRPVPRASVIVAAFLPNEADIIVETLEHLLLRIRRPDDGLEVILAYNTPVRLPIEAELEELVARFPDLRLFRVVGSETKAENLNAALDIVSGEITAILDADHLPRPDCLERAWHWLEGGYDAVQGRSIVRNYASNLETKCIAVEFECMYGVSHPARSLLVDTAIFGGSNGYWRTEVLRRVRFNPRMMTEDIDASVRALLQGHRIVADRSIISTELAVDDFRSFWFQRKRWAQGWLQVSLRYQREVWKSSHLGLRQKLYWTYLLGFRELYPLLSLQVFPVLFSLILIHGALPPWSHWYLWSTALVTLASGPLQVVVATKNAVTGFPRRYAVGYSFFVFFYVMLKNMIWVIALYDHLTRNTDWIVTRRALSDDMRRREEEQRKSQGNGVWAGLHQMRDALRSRGLRFL